MFKTFSSYISKSISWTKSLAGRKNAVHWLAVLSFTESSIFPLPADLLFVPMVSAKKHKAYFYAFIASISSTLGTILGWIIGKFFFEIIALPIVNFYNKYELFLHMQNTYSMNMVLVLLVLSGFSHIPPIKIVTILAGVLSMNLGIFLLASFVTRFARFYFLAWLAKNYGQQIIKFIAKRLSGILIIFCILLITGYIFWL